MKGSIFILIIIFLINFNNSANIKITDGGSTSSSSSNSDSDSTCNQQIIAKDWGFKYLKTVFDNGTHRNNTRTTTTVYSEYWTIEYLSALLDLSFVTKLQESFFTTDVVGYNAIKLEYNGGNRNNVDAAYFWLNQTMDVIANGSYSISFRVSTTLSNFDTSIYLNEALQNIIPPSQNTYDRTDFSFYLSSFDMIEPQSNLSISFSYAYMDQIPIIYIENLKVLRNSDLKLGEVYVSNTGSDVSGDGTLMNPFSSIEQAFGFAVPESSTIYLSPGLYCGMGNSYLDSSSLESVKIQSLDPNNKAIISGEYELIQVDFSSFNKDLNVTFENLIFAKSSMRPGGVSININGNCTITIYNCDFYEHLGDAVVSLDFLNYGIFYNCTFTSNSQYAIQSIGVFDRYALRISNCIFNSINSINLLNINNVEIVDCVFSYSKDEPSNEKQCPILIDMVDYFMFYQTTIHTAACVYRSQFLGTNLTFSNQPEDIYIRASVLVLNSYTLLDNIYFGEGITNDCLSVFQGSLYLTNSIFNGTNSQISIQVEGVIVQIKNVTCIDEWLCFIGSSTFGNLTEIQSYNTFTFMVITKSVIYLKNSTFEGNGDPIMVVQSELYTTNCYFAESFEPIFNIATSYYYDQGSLIEKIQSSILTTEGKSFISLNGTIVKDNSLDQEEDTALMVLNELSNTIVNNCQFINNNYSSSKGAVFTISQSSIQIFSSVFINNTANCGAVAYLDGSSSITMTNVNATGNIAKQDGGVIYSDSSLGTINIYGGNYWNNQVIQGSGELIYYYGSSPKFYDNPLIANQSIVLGQIFMKLTTNIPTILQSGSTGYEININFVNNKGAGVKGYKFDKNKKLFISMGSEVMSSLNFPKSDPDSFAVLNIKSLTLTGPINTKQTLYLSSDSPTVTTAKIQFSFEACSAGYYPNEQNTLCIPCPYSTVGTDGETCQLCPTNAECFGANNIAGIDGYWIDYNDSLTTVYQCPAGVCFLNDTTYSTSCAEFSTGVLCASCQKGYYNCGSGCKKETSINKLVLSSKIVMFVVLVVAQQLSNDSSGLVTIVLYFLQTLVVISSGIKFSILNLFSGASSAHAGKSDGILSFLNDCMGPFGFYWNHYFVVLQPVFLLLILGIIIILEFSLRKTKIIFKIPLVKNIIEKNDKEFRNRQFSAFVKVCMNSYGPFATEVLLILFCNQVGSYYLLNANPEVQCSGDNYYTARTVTCSLIAILGIFPLLVFILLYRHKDKLDDKDVERKLGVFYLKYIPKLYYWDVILLLKRFSIVTISLLPFESKFRSISLVTLGLVYLFIHLKYQPFLTDQDNNLETVSLILLFISCIYLDNGLYEDTEQYILIICIVVFAIAAIKFQSKYLVSEFNRAVYPVIQTIWQKITCSNNDDDNQLNVDDEYRVVYNTYGDEEERIKDDEQYSYDSIRNIVKEVDKKGTFYNFNENINKSYTYDDDDQDDDDGGDNNGFFSNSIAKRRV